MSFFLRRIWIRSATYGLRPDEPVRTASTIKLPILAATFQAVAEGKIKWTDFTTLRKEDKVSGSGILGEFARRLPIHAGGRRAPDDRAERQHGDQLGAR
jgi:hypothetical protein